MIATYLDSSALMRLVAREGDVSVVEEAMQSAPTSSVLAELELHAAIFKRWHDGDITDRDRDGLLAITETRILPALTLVSLRNDVLTEARVVVALHPLRTLDALHIATAIQVDRIVKRRGSILRFCTADRRQAEVAQSIFGSERVALVPPWRGKHAVGGGP